MTESLTGASEVESAEGVKGAVIERRDSFVTCALNVFALFDKRVKGSGCICDDVAVVVAVAAFCVTAVDISVDGAVSNAVWNCSESAREVLRRIWNFSDIFLAYILYQTSY